MPTPLPVPITPVEQVTTLPGDVVMTWTDTVPKDATYALIAFTSWALALLVYTFWRIFRHRAQLQHGKGV
ncbi:hypothetical protein [Stomatohabitans albus]|uniref:hypothetical protein n=1 Tax=Stomatohabitans albus TaxID=3110766 RepID=UPI00300CF240